MVTRGLCLGVLSDNREKTLKAGQLGPGQSRDRIPLETQWSHEGVVAGPLGRPLGLVGKGRRQA